MYQPLDSRFCLDANRIVNSETSTLKSPTPQVKTIFTPFSVDYFPLHTSPPAANDTTFGPTQSTPLIDFNVKEDNYQPMETHANKIWGHQSPVYAPNSPTYEANTRCDTRQSTIMDSIEPLSINQQQSTEEGFEVKKAEVSRPRGICKIRPPIEWTGSHWRSGPQSFSHESMRKRLVKGDFLNQCKECRYRKVSKKDKGHVEKRRPHSKVLLESLNEVVKKHAIEKVFLSDGQKIVVDSFFTKWNEGFSIEDMTNINSTTKGKMNIDVSFKLAME